MMMVRWVSKKRVVAVVLSGLVAAGFSYWLGWNSSPAPVSASNRQDLTELPLKGSMTMDGASIRTWDTRSGRISYFLSFADTSRLSPEQKHRIVDELLDDARDTIPGPDLTEKDRLLALILLAEFRPIPRVREYLQTVASRPSSSSKVREYAVNSWSWHLQLGYSASDVATMLTLLRSTDEKIRLAAISSCSNCQMRECRPALRQLLLGSEDKEERQSIRRTLEAMAEWDRFRRDRHASN